MSRFEKTPLGIIEGSDVVVENGSVLVKSSKGELSVDLPEGVMAAKESDKILRITTVDNTKRQIAFVGLVYRMIQNAMIGLTKGFKKELQIMGVGYRWNVIENVLNMQLGFSHDIVYNIPDGIQMVAKANTLTIEGVDKQLVGQVVANVKSFRPVEPYKGKGIRLKDQHVIRKVGKSGGS